MPHHCIPCDRYFGTQQSLQQHMKSPAHDFSCDECDRSFATKQALEQHLSSPAHAIECKECDRTFGTQHALEQHLSSPAHAFDCKERDRRSGTQSSLQQHRKSSAHVPRRTVVEYLGHPRSDVTPVFVVAKRLRYREPTVDDVLRHVKTSLEHPIVAALIAAALRLLPVDNTPQGVELRIEKHRVKAFESKLAEDGFCAKLTRLGYDFLREHQQEGETSTPDIRFIKPIFVYGHLCWWLKYKNYFGYFSFHSVADPVRKRCLEAGRENEISAKEIRGHF